MIPGNDVRPALTVRKPRASGDDPLLEAAVMTLVV